MYRRHEYPNFTIILELITSISGSNSSVERTFSTLTLLVSDHRLSMDHKTMENLLVIKSNDHVWSSTERKSILTRAVKLYLEKRRKVSSNKKSKEDNTPEEINTSDSDNNDSDDDDDAYFALLPEEDDV